MPRLTGEQNLDDQVEIVEGDDEMTEVVEEDETTDFEGAGAAEESDEEESPDETVEGTEGETVEETVTTTPVTGTAASIQEALQAVPAGLTAHGIGVALGQVVNDADQTSTEYRKTMKAIRAGARTAVDSPPPGWVGDRTETQGRNKVYKLTRV